MLRGTTKKTANTRIKEHQRNCRQGNAEKFAVAGHTTPYNSRLPNQAVITIEKKVYD